MEDLKTWIVKILLPAIVVITIKLTLQAKKQVVSWFSIISSFAIGIGTAYIFADYVMESLDHKYVSIAIAVLSISGERIWIWFVYKFNVESILEGLLDKIRKK